MVYLSVVFFIGFLFGCSGDSSLPSEVKANTGIGGNGSPELGIVLSDYSATGQFLRWDIARGRALENPIPIHTDALVRSLPDGSGYVVVNRLGSDSLQRISVGADGLSQTDQWHSPVFNNLQDVAPVTADGGWVVGLVDSKVHLVDWRSKQIQTSVSLTEVRNAAGFKVTDADGSAEPNRLLLQGDKLWIQFALLDRNTPNFRPAHRGYISSLNTKTRELAQAIDLPGGNPVADLVLFSPEELWVSMAGQWGIDDASVGRIRVRSGASLWALEPYEVKGDLVGTQFYSDQLAFAVIDSVPGENAGEKKSQVVAFNPTTARPLAVLAQTAPFSLSQILVDQERGVLLIVDRSAASPGIRVFDVATLTERVEQKIATPVPPAWIVLGGK